MPDDLTTERLVEAGATAAVKSYTRDFRRCATVVDCVAMRAAIRAILARAGVDVADASMADVALTAHAERMLEEADTFPAATGAELRDCAAAFRRVAALLRALAGVLRDE